MSRSVCVSAFPATPVWISDDMAAPLPPDQVQALQALAAQLVEPGARRGELIAAYRAANGGEPASDATVYRRLRQYAGYVPARKPRADKGRSRLPDDALAFIASSRLASVRADGRGTKPIEVAMNIAAQNGFDVNVGSGTVARLLRAGQMDLDTQANARTHIRMRSLHPNHVHQIDPSLCLIFYIGKKQYIMSAELFNKNKPAALEAVKLKVWRYTRYDHASRAIDVRYFEAAGENQASLFEFLMWTWGQQAGRLSHGVPKMLLWDKGSANTSAGIRRLLDALGVHHETHAAHHAWAKGGVESANYIVERQFESRLRDEPVTSIEQLNAASLAWVRDYNANAIQHVDARVRCDDGVPRVRDDMWATILQMPGALVAMPERKVCAWFMHGNNDQRTVRDNRISFAHPQAGKSVLYDLSPWAKDIYNGQRLTVAPMLLGGCALRVWLPAADGSDRHIDVEAVAEFDQFGRPIDNAVIGQEYRTAPHSAAQQVAKQLAAATWGEGTSLDEAEKNKSANARPFAHLNEGKGAVAHSHLGAAELPARLLPKAAALQTGELQAARAARAVAPVLSLFEAARQLAARLGAPLAPAQLALLRQLHPEGVPEDQLDALHQRLATRGALRVVGSE